MDSIEWFSTGCFTLSSLISLVDTNVQAGYPFVTHTYILVPGTCIWSHITLTCVNRKHNLFVLSLFDLRIILSTFQDKERDIMFTLY